jgi:hypothetical protein
MGTFAETTNVDYRLSLVGQGNKRPFSVYVCSKQMEVRHFQFLFAENKRKL